MKDHTTVIVHVHTMWTPAIIAATQIRSGPAADRRTARMVMNGGSLPLGLVRLNPSHFAMPLSDYDQLRQGNESIGK
jgi:hypothetical protein